MCTVQQSAGAGTLKKIIGPPASIQPSLDWFNRCMGTYVVLYRYCFATIPSTIDSQATKSPFSQVNCSSLPSSSPLSLKKGNSPSSSVH